MWISSRGRGAAASACAAIIALIPIADGRADDDDTQQPIDPPGPRRFVRSEAAPPDLDPLVNLAPHSANDPRVGALLAAHPDRDVLICLAGCGGGPKVVSIRYRVAEIASEPLVQSIDLVRSRTNEMRPSSGEARSGSLADPRQARPEVRDQPEVGDVICLAGCIGGPGEVVQTAVRLTWIDHRAGEELRSALRGLADRLLAQEAEMASIVASSAPAGRHHWMPDAARRALVETPLPATLAALVRSATALVRTSPLRSP